MEQKVCVCLGIIKHSIANIDYLQKDMLCKILYIGEQEENMDDEIIIRVSFRNPIDQNMYEMNLSTESVSILRKIDDFDFRSKETYFNKYGEETFLQKYDKRDTLEFPCVIGNMKFSTIKELERYIKNNHERY